MGNRHSYNWLSSRHLKIPLVISIIFLAGTVSSNAQSGLIPEEYLRIVPGVSVRADVEKLFSRSEDDKSHLVDYDHPDLFVGVEYSVGHCK